MSHRPVRGPLRRIAAVLTGLAVLLGLMTGLAGAARAGDSSHPGAPVAVEITDTTVTVRWTAPTAPGEILHYQVVKNGGTVIGTTTGTTFTATGLVPNREYSFAAVAVPRVGHPASSVHTRVRTTGTTPPMPAEPVVMGVFTEKGSHERGFRVKDLLTGGSAAELTHLTYGYGTVDGGQCRIGDAHAALERSFTAANSVSGRGGRPCRLVQREDLRLLPPARRQVEPQAGARGAPGLLLGHLGVGQ